MIGSQLKKALSTTWQSPSNIAIIKYWGKQGVQIPLNPSVSFSLSNALTTTGVEAALTGKKGFSMTFEGKEAPLFTRKIESFFHQINQWLPNLNNYFLSINSSNTFPHSSGIASSASAMSALALCLTDLESKLNHTDSVNLQLASNLARLGSGSASRSVYGGWNIWGYHPEIPESSNEYAISLPFVPAPVFQTLQDHILIISSKPKEVSSSSGHKLMEHHPYLNGRLRQANKNISELLKYLREGDLEGFMHIAENEALSLHALMMSSSPGYTLLNPNTLEVISRLKSWRKSSGIPIGFTLDAGPNLHLLFPLANKSQVEEWINEDILFYCEQKQIIKDHVGTGPKMLT